MPYKRYAITEGRGPERALRFAAHNLARGVEMLQIREKQLGTPELTALVERIMRLPNPHGTRMLVNSRPDIARACGAYGVHLPAALAGQAEGLPHGTSCHTIAEVQAAGQEGAEFAVFGPVFATGGKAPLGLDALREAAQSAGIPVYALGGITAKNAAACIAAGAAGIAGIRLFRP